MDESEYPTLEIDILPDREMQVIGEDAVSTDEEEDADVMAAWAKMDGFLTDAFESRGVAKVKLTLSRVYN